MGVGKGSGPWRLWLALSASLVLLVSGASLWADEDWRALHSEVQAGRILSLETILAALQKDYLGQVIDVDFEEEDGIRIYEVELLGEGGQVLEFDIDAVTGKVLSIEGRDIEAMRRR